VDRLRPVLRDLEEVGAEEIGRSGVEVELVNQEHVRPLPLDHLGYVADLAPKDVVDIRVRRVGDQQSCGTAVERSVERGEADLAARGSGGRNRSRTRSHGHGRH
jgi:hypothetical protein